MTKRIWHGLLAALTSPQAVKQEKSLLTLVIGRVLLTAGASYGTIELVSRLIGAA